MVKTGDLIDAEDGGRRQLARAEAALWVVRAGGRPGAVDEPVDRWLEDGEANAAAYAETLTVWSELGHILPDWKHDDAAPAASAAPRRRGLAQVAVFASLALACLFGWQWYMSPEVYRTAIAEQRIVQLADGTKVTLNTDTEVRIARWGSERRVELSRGEALFNVAHDPARPFIVNASGHYVRALGTAFVVRRLDEKLDVVLLSGAVRVGATGAAQSIDLTPGDRYSLDRGPPRLDRPSLEAVTAWRNGELVLDQTPLADAVAEMNRYRAKPIELRGEGLGALRLSGVFRITESDNFARTVGQIYGLPVTERSGMLVIGPQSTR